MEKNADPRSEKFELENSSCNIGKEAEQKSAKKEKAAAWSLKKVISKELWPRKFSVFKWKRVDFQMTILDDVVYKILSVVEAVVLVSTLCFFFLCCGCHI